MIAAGRDPLAGVVAPLFVPAHRPERFGKAAASGADAVILDLEDAVPADAKDAARAALATGFTGLPVLVRINPPGTPWHDADLAAAAALGLAGIMFPKAEQPAHLARAAAAHRVVALVESARGLAAVRDLAASARVSRLAFGSIDFAADLGCAHERHALAAARAEIVLASRLAGLPGPLDGVTTALGEADAVADDARHARALGFGGKLLIHPRQVRPALDAFAPNPAEIDWARRVLAAGDGAIRLDGEMVDEPVRARARAVLDRVRPRPA